MRNSNNNEVNKTKHLIFLVNILFFFKGKPSFKFLLKIFVRYVSHSWPNQTFDYLELVNLQQKYYLNKVQVYEQYKERSNTKHNNQLLNGKNNNITPFFGSDRSSGSHFVCPSVCPFGDKLSRAVNLYLSRSESTQRAIEQSESSQRALKSESYSRSL